MKKYFKKTLSLVAILTASIMFWSCGYPFESQAISLAQEVVDKTISGYDVKMKVTSISVERRDDQTYPGYITVTVTGNGGTISGRRINATVHDKGDIIGVWVDEGAIIRVCKEVQ